MLTYQRLKRFEARSYQANVSRRRFRRRFLVGAPLAAVVVVCGCFYAKNAVDLDSRRRLVGIDANTDANDLSTRAMQYLDSVHADHRGTAFIHGAIEKAETLPSWDQTKVVEELRGIFISLTAGWALDPDQQIRVFSQIYEQSMMNLICGNVMTEIHDDTVDTVEKAKTTVLGYAEYMLKGGSLRWDQIRAYLLSDVYTECCRLTHEFLTGGWIDSEGAPQIHMILFSNIMCYLVESLDERELLEDTLKGGPIGELLKAERLDPQDPHFEKTTTFYSSHYFNVSVGNSLQLLKNDEQFSDPAITEAKRKLEVQLTKIVNGRLYKALREHGARPVHIAATVDNFINTVILEELAHETIPFMSDVIASKWDDWIASNKESGNVPKERTGLWLYRNALIQKARDLEINDYLWYYTEEQECDEYKSKGSNTDIFHMCAMEARSLEEVENLWWKIEPAKGCAKKLTQALFASWKENHQVPGYDLVTRVMWDLQVKKCDNKICGGSGRHSSSKCKTCRGTGMKQ